MLNKLKTRAVFVDSCVFFSQNFAVEGTQFASLRALCRAGRVQLILTDVTVQELEAQIEKKFNEAAESLTTARNKTKIARNLNLEFPGLFLERELSAYLKDLKANLHKFLVEAHTKIITVDSVLPSA